VSVILNRTQVIK